jgi:hypothetical protein
MSALVKKDVTCPDCSEEFELEFDPDAETFVQCPECATDLSIEYDAVLGTVKLNFEFDDDEDDEDGDEILVTGDEDAGDE